jgi:hypothetical protein
VSGWGGRFISGVCSDYGKRRHSHDGHGQPCLASSGDLRSEGAATRGSLGVSHGHAKWKSRLAASLAADKDSASPPHTHTQIHLTFKS